MKTGLCIANASISVGGKTVAAGVSLDIPCGAIHALMGPNGSGKSSIAYAIAGHPDYAVTAGLVTLGEVDMLLMKPEERAEAGLFLSFQEPPEVGGVSMRTFLTTIQREADTKGDTVTSVLPRLGLEQAFLARSLNDGFSGGEKKKGELLQLLARRPKVAILDEIDAGLDVDALRGVVAILKEVAGSGTGLLVISHSPRLFRMLTPDTMTILIGGRVTAEASTELLGKVEREGYRAFEIQDKTKQ